MQAGWGDRLKATVATWFRGESGEPTELVVEMRQTTTQDEMTRHLRDSMQELLKASQSRATQY